MEIVEGLHIVGSSEYLTTDDFVIYVAKNPFWADCQTNEVISKVKDKNAIAVNMVDAEDSRYFQPKIFKFIIRTIYEKTKKGIPVYVVCNKGRSRSAAIVLLYLAVTGEINNKSYKEAKSEFLTYYPDYNPNFGVEKFLENTWQQYFK